MDSDEDSQVFIKYEPKLNKFIKCKTIYALKKQSVF